MKNTITQNAAFALIMAVLLTFGASCKVAEKRLRQGDYVEVLNKAINKLQNNPENSRYILLLEEAHGRIMEEELASIQFIANENRPNRWLDVMARYERLEHFQSMIRPLLPLYIPDEYRNANIHIMDLTDPLAEARENSASFLFGEAEKAMATAKRTGNKHDYRQAHDILEELHSFMPSYSNSNSMREMAYNNGIDLIMVETINACGLPTALANDLQGMDVRSMNTKWMKFTSIPDERRNPDYLLLTRLTCVESSPDFFNEIHTEESRNLIVRYKDKLDADGNPVLDDEGNVVQVPIRRNVTAKVIETTQRKSAKIGGTMEIYRSSDHSLLRTLPLEALVQFENRFVTATGNLKALSEQTESRLGGGMLPYPSDFNILRDATGLMSNEMMAAARANCHLFN